MQLPIIAVTGEQEVFKLRFIGNKKLCFIGKKLCSIRTGVILMETEQTLSYGKECWN